MSTPLGNQFWKNRSSHGRDKLFATPELMKKAIEQYFNWVDAHPWWRNEQIKKPYLDKDGNMITMAKIATARPYTISGLCIYLDCHSKYFYDFEASLKEKTDQISYDFSHIITWAKEIIYTQKFEGAAVGAFNANIIARDLGLTDKKEVSQTTIVVETQEEDDE